jgi:ABC-type nitrate/sulfonate/bicarbonate transport system substrate-binding protein
MFHGLAGMSMWLLINALLLVLAPPQGFVSSLGLPPIEASWAQTTPPGGSIPIKIGVPSKTDDFIVVYLAKSLGLFERQGLQATILPMTSSVAMAALQSGELDFWTGAGSGAKAAETGRPVRIVFVSSSAPGQLIIGAKGVSTLTDLRGKSIAVKVPLDTTSLVTQYLLKLAGVPPDAFHLVYARTTENEVALLISGKVAAANLETGPGLLMQARGFPLLASAGSVKLLGTGLVTSLDEIRSKPDVIRRAIAAVKEALRIILSDKARTVAVMERELHEPHEIAAKSYDIARSRWLPDGIPPAEAIQNEIALDTEALQGAHVNRPEPIRPEDILDLSFLQGGAPAGRP